MADASEIGQALDWDMSEAADEGGFALLPAGVYAFAVEKLERERFEGSAKMAACPRAHLTLSVIGADGTTGTVHERMMLNSKMVWRIAQLFKCLGWAEDPETGKVPVAWNEVEGKGGYLKLKVRTYKKKDGEDGEANEVETWLAPGDPAIAAAAQQPAQQTAMPVPPQPAQTSHPGWTV